MQPCGSLHSGAISTRWIIFSLGILIVPAATLLAQEQPVHSATPDPSTMRHLRAVFARQHRVRIDRARAAGMLEADARVTTDSMGIQMGDSPEALIIPWSEIWSVQIRVSSAMRGALTGGLLAGGGSLVLGLASAHQCQGWEFFCGYAGGDVVRGVLIGAVTGAVLGALFAAPLSHWRTVCHASTGLRRTSISVVPTRSGVAAHAALRF